MKDKVAALGSVRKFNKDHGILSIQAVSLTKKITYSSGISTNNWGSFMAKHVLRIWEKDWSKGRRKSSIELPELSCVLNLVVNTDEREFYVSRDDLVVLVEVIKDAASKFYASKGYDSELNTTIEDSLAGIVNAAVEYIDTNYSKGILQDTKR